ncbi:MAG: glycosyltransferase family 4 protein [Planctomycetota bacterium]
MRIVYVSQYFPPEMGAPSARVYEMSREWVRAGHDVTVVTAFPHHPTGIKRPKDRRVLTRREVVDGIEVIRTYVWAAANKGTLKRMASYTSFLVSAATIGRMRIRKPDVVVATSPQLFAGVAGWMLARTLRVPFVFEVRDLWPESILAVDAMKENFVIRGLKRVARNLYRRSDHIVTVGDGYRRKIHELYGTPLEKMEVIPNGIDPDLFRPREKNSSLREEYNWGDRFVSLYLGTHGMAHALSHVLETAERLRDDPRFLFAFVGEGAEKEALKTLAEERNLKNVQFIDQQAKERVPDFYAACDLGLVTLRDTPLFQEVLPSKIFEYQGMARPIVIAVGGEARRIVEDSGCGEYVPPENSEAMANTIRRLASDSSRLGAMGRSGRDWVLQNHNRTRLAERYVDVLQSVIDARAPKRQRG